MQVNVSVMLGEGQTLAGTAEETAIALLELLGGDPDVDQCLISVTATPQQALIGSPPVPPPPVMPTQLPYIAPPEEPAPE